MRWLLNVLKAVVVLALLLSATGLLLPEQRRVERSIEVPAPPSRIWPLVADPRRWPQWSPWFAKDPAMVLQFAGAASEAGAEWRWQSKTQGTGRMRFDAAEPPTRLTYTLFFDDMDEPAHGAFLFEPLEGAATRVTWQLDAAFGWNPLARWFGLALERMVGSDFDSGLARLAQQVPVP